jgi:hypothetical protein
VSLRTSVRQRWAAISMLLSTACRRRAVCISILPIIATALPVTASRTRRRPADRHSADQSSPDKSINHHGGGRRSDTQGLRERNERDRDPWADEMQRDQLSTVDSLPAQGPPRC